MNKNILCVLVYFSCINFSFCQEKKFLFLQIEISHSKDTSMIRDSTFYFTKDTSFRYEVFVEGIRAECFVGGYDSIIYNHIKEGPEDKGVSRKQINTNDECGKPLSDSYWQAGSLYSKTDYIENDTFLGSHTHSEFQSKWRLIRKSRYIKNEKGQITAIIDSNLDFDGTTYKCEGMQLYNYDSADHVATILSKYAGGNENTSFYIHQSRRYVYDKTGNMLEEFDTLFNSTPTYNYKRLTYTTENKIKSASISQNFNDVKSVDSIDVQYSANGKIENLTFFKVFDDRVDISYRRTYYYKNNLLIRTIYENWIESKKLWTSKVGQYYEKRYFYR